MKSKERYCVDCWENISQTRRDSVRCIECAKYYQMHGGQRKKLEETARREARQKRELIAAEFGSKPVKVFEYRGQELAEAGRFLIVVGNGQNKPIARRCHDCGQDDSQIQGQWAPAFTDSLNRRGVEKIVLLCLPCYQNRCNLIIDLGEIQQE